jgi:hypothetical protein
VAVGPELLDPAFDTASQQDRLNAIDQCVNTPPPKGGGFGLRLKAGLVRLRRTWCQLT